MQIAHYIGMLHRSLEATAAAFREVGSAHGDEPDVADTCAYLAGLADGQAEALRPFIDRYGEEPEDEPERLHSELFTGTRDGPLALLRDLQDLLLMATEADIAWTLVGQAMSASFAIRNRSCRSRSSARGPSRVPANSSEWSRSGSSSGSSP